MHIVGPRPITLKALSRRSNSLARVPPTTMVASDCPLSLLSFIRRNGRIPEESRGSPWFEDGTIFLVTNDKVFKFLKGLLLTRDTSPWFEERLGDLSDDSVDMVYDYPMIPLDDSSQDLGYFLTAMSDGGGRSVSLIMS